MPPRFQCLCNRPEGRKLSGCEEERSVSEDREDAKGQKEAPDRVIYDGGSAIYGEGTTHITKKITHQNENATITGIGTDRQQVIGLTIYNAGVQEDGRVVKSPQMNGVGP